MFPTLRCYKNDLITSTVTSRTPFGPLQVVTWGQSHSIIRENVGQNLLSWGRWQFFEIIVSHELLGPIERNLQRAQKSSKDLLHPYKCSLTFALFGNTRKYRP